MILIGTDEGIYRWFEGCAWPIYHSLQDRGIAQLASAGAGILVAIDRGGVVLESVNNGMDWTRLPLPEGQVRPTALTMIGTPPRTVVAVKPLALLSRTVGEPIARARLRLPARGFLGLGGTTTATAPATRTSNQAGWDRLPVPAVANFGAGIAPEIRSLVVGVGDSAPWYAAIAGAGLWRTLDAGVVWEQCPGLPTEVYAIRTVAGRPGHVYVATSDGCWLSSDTGLTWEDRSGGLENARYVRAIEVKPDAPDVLLAGAAPQSSAESNAASRDGLGFALYESTNGGKSWSRVKRGNPEILESDTIADIRHDPAAPENVIVALSSGELWVTRNAGFYWMPLARQIHVARTLCPVE